jgi:hypothetical protein
VRLPEAVHPWRAGVAAGGLGALALAWIGYTNINTYFNVQMRDPAVFAAFSTRETVPAKAALEGAGHYSSILASTTMTPSVQGDFLVPTLQPSIRQFDPAGDLPYRGTGPGLIYLETEHDQALADEVARVYPDAIRQPVRAPGGGKPIVEGFRLDPQVISSHQGLQMTSEGDTATWYGGLALDSSGEYGFRVPPGFELRIDDLPLPSAAGTGGSVRLVRGNHAIQLYGVNIPGVLRGLEWRTPASVEWLPIPDRTLYQPPAGGMGLQLTLVSVSADPKAQLREEYIDPVLSHYFHVSPFSRLRSEPELWSAEWIGQLEAPSGGTYSFTLDFSQDAGVWIDDQLILGNVNGLAETRKTTVELAQGRHPIRVRFEKTAEGSPWINLYWSPPNSTQAIIPASALFPPPPQLLGPAH